MTTDAELVALLLTEARAAAKVANFERHAEVVEWNRARAELRAAVLGRLEAERGQA